MYNVKQKICAHALRLTCMMRNLRDALLSQIYHSRYGNIRLGFYTGIFGGILQPDNNC